MFSHKNGDIEIVVIIGSTKFMDDIRKKAWELTNQHKFVLLPIERPENTEDIDIDLLEEFGYMRIDMSDTVFVFNKDCYIGESTRKEIEYAQFNNKKIIYLEEVEK